MNSLMNKRVTIWCALVAFGGAMLWTGESLRAQVVNRSNMGTVNERDNARRSSCQSKLKQISLGLMQYVYDYDEKLPPAKGWVDKVLPYVKSEDLFRCPSVSNPKGSGYAFNSKLSLKPHAKIESPAQTVWVYETTDLKRGAYGIGEKRAFRHFNGSNYAYSDGHVKWTAKANKYQPLFNLKP